MHALALVITAVALLAFTALPVSVHAEQQTERTVLLYLCGSDLETQHEMATYNLKQILRADFSQNDRVKVVVMTGGSDKWHLERDALADPQADADQQPQEISGEYNQIWEARGADALDEQGGPDPNAGKLVLLDGDGITGAEGTAVAAKDKLMSDPQTLKAFINNGVENFPAKKYDLILWDHGGGPAGMQAAVTAARLGHTPVLIEKSDSLGGQLKIACVPPRKYPIEYETDNLMKELQRYDVDVRLNTAVTLDLIRELAPDAVIAATGSVPAVPPIKGVENAVQSWDILDGSSKLPEEQNVVMIGGGIVACETAHMIAKEGRCKVTILEMLPSIANGLESTHLGDLMVEFAELGVEAITNARVLDIREGEVEYAVGDETKTIKCDTSVLATGQRAEGRNLIDEIKADGFRVIIAGDAIRPRKIMDAVREGNFAAYQL